MTAIAAFKTALIAELPSLRAFAISLTGSPDRADDLVQETVMKAWSAHHSFIEGTSLRAWLFTIMRNTFFSQCRKSRREVQDSEGTAAARLVSPPAQQGHVDFADFLEALKELGPDQREALILIGASGFSYEEAAQIVGCAVGTLKSRVNRARQRLMQSLSIDSLDDIGSDIMAYAVEAGATVE